LRGPRIGKKKLHEIVRTYVGERVKLQPPEPAPPEGKGENEKKERGPLKKKGGKKNAAFSGIRRKSLMISDGKGRGKKRMKYGKGKEGVGSLLVATPATAMRTDTGRRKKGKKRRKAKKEGRRVVVWQRTRNGWSGPEGKKGGGGKGRN